jgi:acylphosphatase
MHGRDEAPAALRLSISGRVQGVAFRASLRAQAIAHGLSGWARNRADGSVEAVLSGAPEAIDAVVRWAARGPGGARVDRLEREAYREAVEEGFQIRPTL